MKFIEIFFWKNKYKFRTVFFAKNFLFYRVYKFIFYRREAAKRLKDEKIARAVAQKKEVFFQLVKLLVLCCDKARKFNWTVVFLFVYFYLKNCVNLKRVANILNYLLFIDTEFRAATVLSHVLFLRDLYAAREE